MRRCVLALATASAVLISMSMMVVPAAAITDGPPTEIGVTPQYVYLPDCVFLWPSDTNYYTVDLFGGLTGDFHVTASWGDGTPNGSWTKAGTFDTHHQFACGHGWRYQTWSASRSGGGTGHDYTSVFTQNI